uniref:Uncharacterized protein n=1 Tax=Hyaloperonospora arabidopsidis (strain Emoy2) TaxID=559515 RepID=M4BUL6_HYAAE
MRRRQHFGCWSRKCATVTGHDAREHKEEEVLDHLISRQMPAGSAEEKKLELVCA